MLVSIVELGIAQPLCWLPLGHVPTNSGSGISIFRSFRLMRVFKLARSWTALQNLLLTIMKSLSGLVYFGILLLLFSYVKETLAKAHRHA